MRIAHDGKEEAHELEELCLRRRQRQARQQLEQVTKIITAAAGALHVATEVGENDHHARQRLSTTITRHSRGLCRNHPPSKATQRRRARTTRTAANTPRDANAHKHKQLRADTAPDQLLQRHTRTPRGTRAT